MRHLVVCAKMLFQKQVWMSPSFLIIFGHALVVKHVKSTNYSPIRNSRLQIKLPSTLHFFQVLLELVRCCQKNLLINVVSWSGRIDFTRFSIFRRLQSASRFCFCISKPHCFLVPMKFDLVSLGSQPVVVF